MGRSYWVCKGIGIRTSDLYPYLNDKKCIDVLKKQLGNDFDSDDEKDFDIDDYFYGEPFENLGDLLCHCDETNTLTFDDNGDGECYFYYTPIYPWDKRENEPLSISDVHNRIVNAVQCICDLSKYQIEAIIDDNICEYGYE